MVLSLDPESSIISSSTSSFIGDCSGLVLEAMEAGFFMVTEAAKGTSSGTGDLAEDADFVEEGLSAEALKRSGELHSLLLLCVVVEAAEDENGMEFPGKNPWGKPIPPVAAATAAAICEGDLNIAIGSISGLL